MKTYYHYIGVQNSILQYKIEIIQVNVHRETLFDNWLELLHLK